MVLISATLPISQAAKDPEFEISGRDSVELPTRTVTFQSAKFNVSSASIINRSESVVLNVRAPEDAGYQVFLYDRKRSIIDARFGQGTDTIQFDNLDYTPGSYMFVLQHNGVTQTIHPLVIQGYNLRIRNISLETNSTIQVQLDVLQIGTAQASTIEVGIGRNGTHRRASALKTGKNQYIARINGSGLIVGNYSVTAIARGLKTAFDTDQKQLIGVAHPQRFYFSGDFPQNWTNQPTFQTSVSRSDGTSSPNVLTPKSPSSPTTPQGNPIIPFNIAAMLAIGILLILVLYRSHRR